MAGGGSAASPTRGNWNGGAGGGYYADPASPIASTPQRGKGRTAARSTQPLSPMKKPDRPLARKAKGATTVGDVEQEGGIFSPNLKYEDEEGAPAAGGGTGGVALHAAPVGRGSPPADAVAARSTAAAPASQVAAAGAQGDAVVEYEYVQEEVEEEYEYEEFNPFLFIKMLPPYSSVVTVRRPLVLPAKSPHAPDVSLVLDLDETLVHCSVDPIPDADLTFPVSFNGATYQVYVRKRPHLDRFLQAIHDKFEVTVFTASQQVYAEKLLNLLDPEKRFIRYRLYRDSCLNVEGNYLKDLSVLGRDLRKTVLVDNSPHAFGYQVDNGIPIESWFEDPRDTELLKLYDFIRTLRGAPDVRQLVRRKFKVHRLVANAQLPRGFYR